MNSAPIGDGLRPSHHVVVSLGENATLPTPARRFCPNTERPGWLPPRQFHCSLDHAVQRAYGVTCDDYHRLLTHQDGVCAVCGGLPGKWRLSIDHDHDPPYEIRGLAHHRCQRWITAAVVRYLTAPPGRELGLRVPPGKARRLEAKAAIKPQRRAADGPPPASTFARELRATLEQTTEQGGRQ